MRLRWTLDAADDLEEITDYLHSAKPELAQSTVLHIYDELKLLKQFPEMGRPLHRHGLRQLLLSPLPYICTYRSDEHAVYLLRIRHTAQEPIDFQ